MTTLRTHNTKTKPSVVKVITITSINPDGTREGSLGSGFLVGEEGVVISNSHVVTNDDPSATLVKLNDGTEKKCIEILHRDKKHDFVIFKIENGKYPFLKLGNYDDIEEGDDIYFCGFPLKSNHHIIHRGVVSSKFTEREINLIQLDGSVNSGNSGGPLLNFDDKVVGVITEKAGGIDKKLMNMSQFLKKAPPVFTLDYTLSDGRKIKVDPTKSLAEVIEIIHDYTNVGIGYAFSIEYAKSKLIELGIIS